MITTVLKSGNRKKLGDEVRQIRYILGQLLREIHPGNSGNYDPDSLASGLFSLIHGGMLLWVIDKDEFPMRAIMERTLSVILDALEAQHS